MRKLFTRFQSIGKELIQVGLGQIVAALGSLVGVRLLTQVMSPSSYGELNLSMTFVILIQQLIMGPITNGFARYFPIAQEKGFAKNYFDTVRILLVKASGVTFLLFLIVLSGLIVTSNKNWVELLFLSFLFSLISSYNSAFDNIQNAARHRIIVVWHQGLSQWLRFFFAVAIINVFDSTSSNAMLGYFISAIVIFASERFFYNKKLSFGSHEDNINKGIQVPNVLEKQIVRFALPFSVWGIFTWAQLSSDRWALQSFTSTATVGFYSVLYQLGYYPIALLTGMFVQFISPILYMRVGDAMDEQRVRSTNNLTNQLTLASLGFALFLTITTWLLKDIIFKLFVAPDFLQVSGLLPWMSLSGGLFAAGQISALSALNNNDPGLLMKPKIATSIFGVFLSFIGSYIFGLKGVVGAGVLFALIYFIWVYWLFNHTSPPNLS